MVDAVQQRADVVIVGAGVMGLAAARALASQGRDVLVLEQFHVGHTRGSSHGSSRVFRLAYDEAEWVRLAQEALALWRGLEREQGVELLRLTGSLDVGRDQSTLRAALDEGGAAYELLAPDEVERRFGIEVHADGALLQPEGGVVWAARALEAFVASAREQGAELREGTRVLSIERRGDRVRVETAEGPLDARVAVVAAGAWAGALLAGAGLKLPVPTRETVVYFALEGEGDLPALVDWRPPEPERWGLERAGALAYSLPAGDGLLKVGLHNSGPETDPSEEGEPDEAVLRYAADWARRRFPLARREPVAADTCLYASTADERFVLEGHGPIVVCSACSGHGFKFAPAVAVRVARLAQNAA